MAHPSSLPSDLTSAPADWSSPIGEERIPPLRAGDHLSVAEFERRYWAMPEETKAELIEGVVYMASPVNDDNHGAPHVDLAGIFANYRYKTPGVRAGDNSTLKGLRGINQPQPDLLLRILPEFGGQSRTEAGYVIGGPEMVAEVAYSSASYDLHNKKTVYSANKVQEYIVWRVEDRAIDWFRLRGGQYESLPPDMEGIVKSNVFPGLWLDAKAMLSEDFPRLMEILNRGIASPEHQAFVQELQKRRESRKNG